VGMGIRRGGGTRGVKPLWRCFGLFLRREEQSVSNRRSKLDGQGNQNAFALDRLRIGWRLSRSQWYRQSQMPFATTPEAGLSFQSSSATLLYDDWYPALRTSQLRAVGEEPRSIDSFNTLRTESMAAGISSHRETGPCPPTTSCGLSSSMRSSDLSHSRQSGSLPASRFGRYSRIKQSPAYKTPSSGTQTERFVGV